ncbi:starch phosphorylase [Mucilaginibacter pineti]|uniref:Starch phosphorylase n=1 Tax=Mucilaginibacter pineti TaxID=1391627 RepID=A0A1G7LMI9_9SPHI|nr:hypothetical protein [Mucilaginibacter pineti]SDF50220.1 starch phosphorylase [Mucilaginibacter pineti]
MLYCFCHFVNYKALADLHCFLIPKAHDSLSGIEKDSLENKNLMDVLENTLLPMYYRQPERWSAIIRKAAADIVSGFEAGRMAKEYYQNLYNV